MVDTGIESPEHAGPAARWPNPRATIAALLWPSVVLVLLAAAVGAVYSQSLGAPFVFDDTQAVLGNPSIRHLWPLWEPAGGAPLRPPQQFPTAGRPLVNLSLALNYHFGQLDPVGYHAFNVVVHVLGAMLLWGIVRRTLRLEFFGQRFERTASALATLVALVWALHPLQTEAVEYVTQRTELMVGFCYLATIYASLRFFTAIDIRDRNNWCAVATIACLAGMACKEVMVTAPLMVLLFDRTFVTGSFRQALVRSGRLYAGLAAGWLLLIALNYNAPRSGSAGFHLGLPATTWWLTQAEVFCMYLKLAFWPWPLSIYYEMPYHSTLSTAWPWVLATGIVVCGTIGLVWKRTALGFVGAWVLLILSPTLVVPIATEVAAERRMYLPLAALVTLILAGGFSLLQMAARRVLPAAGRGWPLGITAAAALMVAGVFAALDVRRLQTYENSMTIWQDTLSHQPDNCLALCNLGIELIAADRPQEALKLLQRALQIQPESPHVQQFFGAALLEQGEPGKAAEHLRKALAIRPDLAEAHDNLGRALVVLGQPQEAVKHLEIARKASPPTADLDAVLGLALMQSGRVQAGIEYLEEAQRLEPRRADIHATLGSALLQINRLDEAVKCYRQALAARA